MATHVILQKFIHDMSVIADQAPVVIYDTAGATWPARPSEPVVVWLGGPSAPGAAVDGDIWIP